MRFIMGININGEHYYSECDVTQEEFDGDQAKFLEWFVTPVLAHLQQSVVDRAVFYKRPEGSEFRRFKGTKQ